MRRLKYLSLVAIIIVLSIIFTACTPPGPYYLQNVIWYGEEIGLEFGGSEEASYYGVIVVNGKEKEICFDWGIGDRFYITKRKPKDEGVSDEDLLIKGVIKSKGNFRKATLIIQLDRVYNNQYDSIEIYCVDKA